MDVGRNCVCRPSGTIHKHDRARRLASQCQRGGASDIAGADDAEFRAPVSEGVAEFVVSRDSRRRGHELRADRIGNRFMQDPIDLGLGRGIKPPASHFVDRLQLVGMTRAP